MQWSCDGATLAVLLKSTELILWDPVKGTQRIETGVKGLEELEWSQDSEYVNNLV